MGRPRRADSITWLCSLAWNATLWHCWRVWSSFASFCWGGEIFVFSDVYRQLGAHNRLLELLRRAGWRDVGAIPKKRYTACCFTWIHFYNVKTLTTTPSTRVELKSGAETSRGDGCCVQFLPQFTFLFTPSPLNPHPERCFSHDAAICPSVRRLFALINTCFPNPHYCACVKRFIPAPHTCILIPLTWISIQCIIMWLWLGTSGLWWNHAQV